MLKLSEGKRANKSITLRLEGRIVGPWVGELRQICELLLSDDSKVSLEMAEVSFVDESGLSLLVSLRSRGAKLLDATPFVEEQLKSAALATTSQSFSSAV